MHLLLISIEISCSAMNVFQSQLNGSCIPKARSLRFSQTILFPKMHMCNTGCSIPAGTGLRSTQWVQGVSFLLTRTDVICTGQPSRSLLQNTWHSQLKEFIFAHRLKGSVHSQLAPRQKWHDRKEWSRKASPPMTFRNQRERKARDRHTPFHVTHTHPTMICVQPSPPSNILLWTHLWINSLMIQSPSNRPTPEHMRLWKDILDHHPWHP